jgi:hypothetical protein
LGELREDRVGTSARFPLLLDLALEVCNPVAQFVHKIAVTGLVRLVTGLSVTCLGG